jgi:hypothetical protein
MTREDNVIARFSSYYEDAECDCAVCWLISGDLDEDEEEEERGNW